MTREQIKKQFPDATEEQITALLNINGIDVATAKKNTVDPKELKRLQEVDSKYKELEEANLTDAEKVSKALKAAEDTKLEFARKSSRLEVEKILVAAGLTEDEYKDVIDSFVGEDAEKSKVAATAFTSIVTKQKESAIQKTKEELMNSTDKPGGNGGSDEDDNKTAAEKFAEGLSSSNSDTSKTTNSILDSYK